PVDPSWIGRRLTEIEAAAGGRVAYFTRLGEGQLPEPDTVYQEGDFLHLAVRRDDLATAERALDTAPPTV
ncbi:MAG: TrkA family potassium uptake protein, partial [Phycicoccus sp.]